MHQPCLRRELTVFEPPPERGAGRLSQPPPPPDPSPDPSLGPPPGGSRSRQDANLVGCAAPAVSRRGGAGMAVDPASSSSPLQARPRARRGGPLCRRDRPRPPPRTAPRRGQPVSRSLLCPYSRLFSAQVLHQPRHALAARQRREGGGAHAAAGGRVAARGRLQDRALHRRAARQGLRPVRRSGSRLQRRAASRAGEGPARRASSRAPRRHYTMSGVHARTYEHR